MMKTGALICLCGFLLSALGGPAVGQSAKAGVSSDIIQDTGVANRLVAGEVLRALSFEVPAAACHLHANVGSDDARNSIVADLELANALLNALTQGDVFEGIIGAETRRKTLLQLQELQSAWTGLGNAVQGLLDEPADRTGFEMTRDTAGGLPDLAAQLLTTLDAQYSGSAEILRRDVMFIQVAGRMAALNQQIALEACQLWSGPFDAARAAQLKLTMDQYRNSQLALSAGLPSLNLPPPQAPGIVDKLAEIQSYMADGDPLLQLVAVGEEIDLAQRERLYADLVEAQIAILDLLYLYQDHSKVH